METKTGFLNDLSENQSDVVLAVRRLLLDDLPVPEHPRWNDWNVLRFCRARRFDFEATVQLIDEYLKWMTRMKFDRLGELKIDTFDRFRQLSGFGLCGTDRRGRPILIDSLGHLKAKALLAEYPEEAVLAFYTQMLERVIHIVLPECSRSAVRRIEQICVIIDLKDAALLSLFSGRIKALLKSLIEVFQTHYPELLGDMIIINGGIVFAGVWAVLKGWIEPATRAKIEVFGGSGKKKLFALVDPKALPVSLKGSFASDVRQDPGPWRDALERSYELGTVFHPNQAVVRQYYYTDAEKIRYLEKKVKQQQEKKALLAQTKPSNGGGATK